MKKKIMVLLIALMMAGCNQGTTIDANPTRISPTATVIKPTSIINPTPIATEETLVIPEGSFRGVWEPEPIVYDWQWDKEKHGDGDKYNGYYYYLNDQWIPGVVDVESQYLIMPDVVIGSAWGYEPEMMLATAHSHNLSLTGLAGGVALPFCSEVGNYVWMKRPYNPGILGTGEWEGPFLVSDCAGIGDIYNVTAIRDEVVEVDFDTARYWTMVKNFRMSGEDTAHYAWDMRKIDEVIVSKINPKDLPDNFKPVRLSDWFKERVTFYKNEEEYNKHFGEQILVLDKYNHEERYMEWRIDGVWRRFSLNEIPTLNSIMVPTQVVDPQFGAIPKQTKFVPTFYKHEYQIPDELIAYEDNWIEVDLSEQMLYLHNGNNLIAGFRVSTGKSGTETTSGLYKIYGMYSSYTMIGADYYTENIPWVIFYHGEFAIHSADWHNDFGTPVSHGCINMTVDDAKWIYDNMEKWDYVHIHE